MATTDSSRGLVLQWAVNETSDSFVSVATGMLRAATSDNIQVTALLAVESFGATLAVCQETQTSVEFEAKKTHTSYVFDFLKSRIGYCKNDAAHTLAKSTAGLRFLSLAACLSTLGSYQAALCLQSMMKSSVKDGQLLPGVIHLRDVFSALECKIANVGFAQHVLGWQLLLHEQLKIAGRDFCSRSITGRPRSEVIQAMVDAFRELERIGDATSIHISSGSNLAWIIAFVKWCLGKPPSLVLKNGPILIDQSSSTVVIQADTDHGKCQIQLFRELKNLSHIWSSSEEYQPLWSWSGLISVQLYAKLNLSIPWLSESDNELRHEGMHQMLVYALKMASTRLILSSTCTDTMSRLDRIIETFLRTRENLSEDLGVDQTLRCRDLPQRKYLSYCFASQNRIEETLSLFLDRDVSVCKLKDYRDDERLIDLENIPAFFEKLEANCKCFECSNSYRWKCTTKESFQQHLSWITSLILAISLFDCTEPIKLHHNNHPMHRHRDDEEQHRVFVDAVHNVLFHYGTPQPVLPYTQVLKLALSLIGHNVTDDLENGVWVASAYHGQTVFLRTLEAGVVVQSGLLCFGGGPGALIHENISYEKARSPGFREPKSKTNRPSLSHTTYWPGHAPRPKIVDPAYLQKSIWQVTADEHYLQVRLLIKEAGVFNYSTPLDVIGRLIECLYIPPCAHASNTPYHITSRAESDRLLAAERSNKDSKISNTDTTDARPSKVRRLDVSPIVPVARNEALQFSAVVDSGVAVVKMGSCLQCAVEICNLVDYRVVIC